MPAFLEEDLIEDIFGIPKKFATFASTYSDDEELDSDEVSQKQSNRAAKRLSLDSTESHNQTGSKVRNSAFESLENVSSNGFSGKSNEKESNQKVHHSIKEDDLNSTGSDALARTALQNQPQYKLDPPAKLDEDLSAGDKKEAASLTTTLVNQDNIQNISVVCPPAPPSEPVSPLAKVYSEISKSDGTSQDSNNTSTLPHSTSRNSIAIPEQPYNQTLASISQTINENHDLRRNSVSGSRSSNYSISNGSNGTNSTKKNRRDFTDRKLSYHGVARSLKKHTHSLAENKFIQKNVFANKLFDPNFEQLQLLDKNKPSNSPSTANLLATTSPMSQSQKHQSFHHPRSLLRSTSSSDHLNPSRNPKDDNNSELSDTVSFRGFSLTKKLANVLDTSNDSEINRHSIVSGRIPPSEPIQHDKKIVKKVRSFFNIEKQ